MVTASLSQNILRLVAGLMLVTALSILAAVWIATTNQARQHVDSQLAVAQNVFEQTLSNRETLLFNSASVLTNDFGFRQAVATRDRPTIDSALRNQAGRIDADLMAIISLEGLNLSAIPEVMPSGSEFPYPDLVSDAVLASGAGALLMIDNQLYQVIMLTVKAPAPIAVALVGFAVDEDLIANMKEITQLETSIQVLQDLDLDQDQAEQFLISTLPAEALLQALGEESKQLSWLSATFLDDSSFLSREFVLESQQGFQVVITLTDSLQNLLVEFNRLQITISVISLAAILLALLSGSLLARQLAKPLVALAQAARQISTGDYGQEISSHSSSKELVQLTSAFQSMQAGIRDREREIVYRAEHDILTSLKNRYAMEIILAQKFEAGEPLQAIGLNIYSFRGINDVFGYKNGDLCLQTLATRVSELGGLAARLTGGELLWVPENPLSEAEIRRVKLSLELPIETGEVPIGFQLAVGVLNCPHDATDAEQLFRRMNVVLDEAQMTRQLVLSYSSEYEERYLRRLSIITELKTALTDKQNELSLVYQPKLQIGTGEIRSIEALIRWNSGKLGFVSPEDFIGVAEHAGLIEQVTDWVLKTAVRDAVKLKEAGLSLSIAINLSTRDVGNDKLLPRIITLLNKARLDSSALAFEITESDLLKDAQAAIAQLQAYRNAGFSIAIDDFGTGYSSMSYLGKLPVTELKIDKSFVLKLDTELSSQSIVRMVIELAHSFGLDVVAEGVENKKALKILKKLGCDWAQGYHICRPVPMGELLEWHIKNQQTQWLEV